MALAVHPWPGPEPEWDSGLLVISVMTPGGERGAARTRIRAAVTDVLAQSLRGDVALRTSPGQAPVILIDGVPSPIGLSISHAGDLSVAALNRAGPVGIDLMEVQAVSDWARVAHDYLGMAVACRLAAMSDADRPHAFAQAWAEREAQLKLAGLPLSEWTSGLDEGRVLPLDVPAGFAGALAVQGQGPV
jgi:4'-phosphopantetheinyl transferase